LIDWKQKKLYTKVSTLETKRVQKGTNVETLHLIARIYETIGAVVAVIAFVSFIWGLISGRKYDRTWNDGNTKKSEKFFWGLFYWILGFIASVIMAIICGTLWPAVIGFMAKEKWLSRSQKKGPA